jgi:hypothetical protein
VYRVDGLQKLQLKRRINLMAKQGFSGRLQGS